MCTQRKSITSSNVAAQTALMLTCMAKIFEWRRFLQFRMLCTHEHDLPCSSIVFFVVGVPTNILDLISNGIERRGRAGEPCCPGSQVRNYGCTNRAFLIHIFNGNVVGVVSFVNALCVHCIKYQKYNLPALESLLAGFENSYLTGWKTSWEMNRHRRRFHRSHFLGQAQMVPEYRCRPTLLRLSTSPGSKLEMNVS